MSFAEVGPVNYYDVLGVPQNASESEVRKAYHKLAIHWHPDKNPDNIAEATRKFQLLQVAESTLLDPEKRAHYDHQLQKLQKERPKQQQDERKMHKKECHERHHHERNVKHRTPKKKDFVPFHYHEVKRREDRHKDKN